MHTLKKAKKFRESSQHTIFRFFFSLPGMKVADMKDFTTHEDPNYKPYLKAYIILENLDYMNSKRI